MPQDSTGKPLEIGDRVRCRGGVYTVKGFSTDPTYPPGLYRVYFEEDWGGPPADETMVDRVDVPPDPEAGSQKVATLSAVAGEMISEEHRAILKFLSETIEKWRDAGHPMIGNGELNGARMLTVQLLDFLKSRREAQT